MDADVDIDEPEPEWVRCRLCHGEQLKPGETHACAYAGFEAMSETDELACLEALNAAPIDTWSRPVQPWGVEEYTVGGWRVAVFFDGPDFGSWDYVDHVVSPSGVRFDPWPDAGERALPMSVANWRPPKMGPVEDVVRALNRIADRFRAMIS